jgi:hypothetical protein
MINQDRIQHTQVVTGGDIRTTPRNIIQSDHLKTGYEAHQQAIEKTNQLVYHNEV